MLYGRKVVLVFRTVFRFVLFCFGWLLVFVRLPCFVSSLTLSLYCVYILIVRLLNFIDINYTISVITFLFYRLLLSTHYIRLSIRFFLSLHLRSLVFRCLYYLRRLPE